MTVTGLTAVASVGHIVVSGISDAVKERRMAAKTAEELIAEISAANPDRGGSWSTPRRRRAPAERERRSSLAALLACDPDFSPTRGSATGSPT